MVTRLLELRNGASLLAAPGRVGGSVGGPAASALAVLQGLVLAGAWPPQGGVAGQRVGLEVLLHAVRQRKTVNTIHGCAVHNGVRAQLVQRGH